MVSWINGKSAFSTLIIIQLLLCTPLTALGSASLAVPPTIRQLAEVSDLILMGKVTNIEQTENYIFYTFQVYEYLKNPINQTTFTYQRTEGLIGELTDVSFKQDEEYLLFLVQDIRYHTAYGDYGKILLSEVSSETIDNLRYIYDPNNPILFQDLRISPKEIRQGANTTIRFNITSKLEQETTVGFIIEHHPPPYQVIDEENMTLKYLQYAKSSAIPTKSTITYECNLSTRYTGVNTIVITYLGSPMLTDTFMVTRYTDFMGNPPTVTFELNPLGNYIPLLLILSIFTLGAILRAIYPRQN